MSHATLCVTHCGEPANGYYLCGGCTQRLVGELRRVAELRRHLDATITRQTRTTANVGVTSPAAERPLPINLTAAAVADDLHNVLGTWAFDVAGRHGAAITIASTADAAAYLVAHTSTLRTHPAADELHDEITDAIARAWRAIDRPPERRFAGPCDECGEDLYGRPHRAELRCGHCGAVYDAHHRRSWLLDQARDQLATAKTIARALPDLVGKPITPSMIRGYAHRGRLAPRPPDPTGQARYRVGDVIDLVLST